MKDLEQRKEQSDFIKNLDRYFVPYHKKRFLDLLYRVQNNEVPKHEMRGRKRKMEKIIEQLNRENKMKSENVMSVFLLIAVMVVSVTVLNIVIHYDQSKLSQTEFTLLMEHAYLKGSIAAGKHIQDRSPTLRQQYKIDSVYFLQRFKKFNGKTIYE